MYVAKYGENCKKGKNSDKGLFYIEYVYPYLFSFQNIVMGYNIIFQWRLALIYEIGYYLNLPLIYFVIYYIGLKKSIDK